MMKKWEKPELKVLGVEDTREGVSMTGIYAPEGYEWICASCYGDPRGDIDDKGTTNDGIIYTTPNQTCGDCKVSNRWIKVLKGTKPSVGLS